MGKKKQPGTGFWNYPAGAGQSGLNDFALWQLSHWQIETRLRKRILRHWIKCHTLPTTHPFWHCRRQAEFVARTYSSPFMKLRDLCSPRPEMEIIQPFALSPWSSTLQDFISLSVRAGRSTEKPCMSCIRNVRWSLGATMRWMRCGATVPGGDTTHLQSKRGSRSPGCRGHRLCSPLRRRTRH